MNKKVNFHAPVDGMKKVTQLTIQFHMPPQKQH